MTDDSKNTLNASREIAASSFNGYLMLFIMLAIFLIPMLYVQIEKLATWRARTRAAAMAPAPAPGSSAS